jgi:hypothetical protein
MTIRAEDMLVEKITISSPQMLFDVVESLREFVGKGLIRETGGTCLLNEKGFKILPMRWLVERTFGWLGRNRRMSKDFERLPRTSEALVPGNDPTYAASIGVKRPSHSSFNKQ